ncbi:hypothetical protein KDU71_19040 [Carboxylicivirga sediminis]|uniref:Uncharacterized protein n=1 Tax=Carboxylicivirga sediminis TaxID=2006564 RepID=A0A941IZY2_9BACT|nr:hypothetical protein [Carboxylicivirga sediminis]MBR8537674.1 hypothetical protein [Carboxylicivirga sediminis]
MDLGANVVALFCDEDEAHHHHEGHDVHQHHHSFADSQYSDSCLKHEHENEEHAACHFDVRPVAAKSLDFHPFLVVNHTFQLQVTVKELPKYDIDHSPIKFPEGYNFAVPLRAPPFSV